LNTILNSDKAIIESLFGDPHEVMLAGIPISKQISQTKANVKTDLVIASVGGHPKDINLYQSQKALSHASLLTKNGGIVILIAACPEGSGSIYYEDFMKGINSPQAALEKFKNVQFQVGPHKAFQFSRELIRIKVILVSEMQPEHVRNLLLEPAATMNEAIKLAEQRLPADYSISSCLMPLIQSLSLNDLRLTEMLLNDKIPSHNSGGIIQENLLKGEGNQIILVRGARRITRWKK